MNLLLIISGGIALLAAYFLVCWLLAFLRNMAVDLGDRALARVSAWVRRRRVWRHFTAAHAGEFAGREFQWPTPDEGRTKGLPW